MEESSCRGCWRQRVVAVQVRDLRGLLPRPNFMFLLWTIVLWIGKSSRGCSRFLLIKYFAVTTVDSGRRALEFLGLDEDHSSVDLDNLNVNMIITDYCMPGMTGYDLLKRVKESKKLKEIPVVIMSSENVVPRINRCLEEGAEEFILKPVKLADVERFKGHIIKGLSKEQQQPASNKRKSMSEDLDDLPAQPPERRPRLGELSGA